LDAKHEVERGPENRSNRHRGRQAPDKAGRRGKMGKRVRGRKKACPSISKNRNVLKE